MNSYSIVKNTYDNKEYVVSTAPFNAKRSVQIESGKSYSAQFTFQTGVFINRKNTFLTFLIPVVLINLAESTRLSQHEFHKLVCDLVKNEHIENLKLIDTYANYQKGMLGYFATETNAFSILEMKRRKMINVLFPLF